MVELPPNELDDPPLEPPPPPEEPPPELLDELLLELDDDDDDDDDDELLVVELLVSFVSLTVIKIVSLSLRLPSETIKVKLYVPA